MTDPAAIARALTDAATTLHDHHRALRRLAYAAPPKSARDGAHLALLSAAYSVEEARSDLAEAAATITTWWPQP